MMRLTSRSLLWLAPALMLAAGCGGTTEPDDACENVTCGDNATCSAGACACDSGFEGDATAGCTAVVACTDTSCSGHGTCDASSGAVVCDCDEGYTGATCLNCATGYERVSNACVPADACADLECGDHGSCVVDGDASCECDEGYTGPACNLCDEGFKAEGELCVPRTACDTMECTDNATCVLADGVASCQCDEGFASEGDTCVNEKRVDCTDAAPDHATSVAGLVTVSWNPDTEAWDEAAACDWECIADYFETEEGTCINTRLETCDDTGDLPDNSEFVSDAEVEVTYTSADGWSAPAACEVRCQADYTLDGDACIDSREVNCTDPQVLNADPVVALVTQTWTDDGGWSTPDFCAWTCRADFDDLFENGTCLNEAEVDCTTDGNLPDGSQWVEGKKTITYTAADGWTSSTCSFTCEPGKGPTEAGTCDVEQDVVCTSAAPANATTTDAAALVPVTWNDVDQTWSAPGVCPWACNDGYDDFNDAGVCINERTVACVTPDNLPDGAEIIPGDVTITFTDGEWPTPYCDWKCDADHGRVGDECLTEKEVACNDEPPANGHSIDPQQLVTVAWIADAGVWALPAVCDWACNDGYDNFDELGACINERTVACVHPDGMPDGAEIIPDDVTITFTDGVWPTPYCDWKCDANHGRVGDECLTEQWVACDASNPPANQQPVEGEVVITWDAGEQAWTPAEACEFECQEGFDDYFDDGTCANEVVVDCDPSEMPDNSIPPEDTSVTIRFSEGGWSEPDACEWSCIDGYTANGDVCVENVRITECLLDTPPSELFLVGDEATLLALAAGVGVVTGEDATELVGKLCYTTSTLTAPVDPEQLPCVDATYDGAIEMAATLAVASPGVYNYVFVVSGDDGKTWTACDVDGIVEDTVTPGTITFALSTSDQLALVRASTGAVSLPVNGATVTYVRAAVGNDDAGFFVQADAEGPAVFVKYAGTDVAAGDVVSFKVTRVSTTSGNLVYVDTFTDLELVDLADVAPFVQELSDATDLVSNLGDYESEIVSITGFIGGPFVSAGTGHVSAPLHTDGLVSASFELRMPATLPAELFLEQGCLVTVTGPMWRHNAKAQPSAYVADDLEVVCPGLQVTNVEATNNTTVVLTFNRDIHTDWVFDIADHFEIDPVIALEDMVVVGNKITLTTGAQTEGQNYDLLVYELYDLAERPLEDDPTLVSFEGKAAAGGGTCEWTPGVVISQVYGGGGNSGAVYKRDFVELFNRTDADIELENWSIQRASATGSTWGSTSNSGQFKDLSGLVIKANSFLLVTGDGGSTGADLVGDATSGLTLGGTDGKVALVPSLTPLTGTSPDPALWADLVGYGTKANFAVGAPTANLSNSTAARRPDETLCADPTSNATDFVVGTPVARDSSITLDACVCE